MRLKVNLVFIYWRTYSLKHSTSCWMLNLPQERLCRATFSSGNHDYNRVTGDKQSSMFLEIQKILQHFLSNVQPLQVTLCSTTPKAPPTSLPTPLQSQDRGVAEKVGWREPGSETSSHSKLWISRLTWCFTQAMFFARHGKIQTLHWDKYGQEIRWSSGLVTHFYCLSGLGKLSLSWCVNKTRLSFWLEWDNCGESKLCLKCFLPTCAAVKN